MLKKSQSVVSSASHELNNPVTAIQGECEITLMKSRSQEEYVEALTRISVESKRLSHLIKNLLFLSRQEELLRNSLEDIDLEVLLKDVAEENERIQLFINTDDSNGYLVIANYYLMNIAIRNIIENACKYSEKEINIYLKKKDGRIILEIKDFGIGIPENEITNVFQSFYRATNTRNYHGQGIGLSLSIKILSAFGAKMEIESKVNDYTRVSVIYT